MNSQSSYFVSNEKNLYKVSIYSVNDNDELEAQLINESPVSTFSYKASAKEDITVKFENNETYTIENSLYKQYNIYVYEWRKIYDTKEK